MHTLLILSTADSNITIIYLHFFFLLFKNNIPPVLIILLVFFCYDSQQIYINKPYTKQQVGLLSAVAHNSNIYSTFNRQPRYLQ